MAQNERKVNSWRVIVKTLLYVSVSLCFFLRLKTMNKARMACNTKDSYHRGYKVYVALETQTQRHETKFGFPFIHSNKRDILFEVNQTEKSFPFCRSKQN